MREEELRTADLTPANKNVVRCGLVSTCYQASRTDGRSRSNAMKPADNSILVFSFGKDNLRPIRTAEFDHN